MKNNWLCVHIAALEPGDESDELFIRGYLAAKNEALALAERAEREAPPDLASTDELVKKFESFAPWIIQHGDICPGEELCECGKRERVQKWREALAQLKVQR